MCKTARGRCVCWTVLFILLTFCKPPCVCAHIWVCVCSLHSTRKKTECVAMGTAALMNSVIPNTARHCLIHCVCDCACVCVCLLQLKSKITHFPRSKCLNIILSHAELVTDVLLFQHHNKTSKDYSNKVIHPWAKPLALLFFIHSDLNIYSCTYVLVTLEL